MAVGQLQVGKPPRPRSYTACTRQSVPVLPRLLMQVPSLARRIRPGQRTLAPADCAASWRFITASRNPTALSSRYLIPGSLNSGSPLIVAHAAVALSERPPGPRARARRNKVMPLIDLAAALYGLGLASELVKIEIVWQPVQKGVELVGRQRGYVFHLVESYHYTSKLNHYFNAYGALRGLPRRRGAPATVAPARGKAFPTKWPAGRKAPLSSRNSGFPSSDFVIKPLLYISMTEETSPTMTSATAQTSCARPPEGPGNAPAEGIRCPKALDRRRSLVSFGRKRSSARRAASINSPDARLRLPHALAEAAVLVPKGVVCLTSALQYHELTLQMPSVVWMAMSAPPGVRSRLSTYPIRALYGVGADRRGGASPHRECGCVHHGSGEDNRRLLRYRTKVGLDVAMEGLREGLRRRR